MMKTSRESGLDYCTHGAEGQVSANRGREEEEEDGKEAGSRTEKTKPVSGRNDPKDLYTEPESGPGEDAPDKPQPDGVSGDDQGELHTGPEAVLGRDCVEKTKLETVSTGDPPKTKPASEEGAPDKTDLASGANGPDEASGVKPEIGSAERDPAVEQYPECMVATTSQRPRPKLSRMERVQSSLSSSSEGEMISGRHRLVLQMAALPVHS